MKNLPTQDSLKGLNKKLFYLSAVPILLAMALAVFKHLQLQKSQQAAVLLDDSMLALQGIIDKLSEQKNSKKNIQKSVQEVYKSLKNAQSETESKALAVILPGAAKLVRQINKVPEVTFSAKKGKAEVAKIRTQLLQLQAELHFVAKELRLEEVKVSQYFLGAMLLILVILFFNIMVLSVVVQKRIVGGLEMISHFINHVAKTEKVPSLKGGNFIEMNRVLAAVRQFADKAFGEREDLLQEISRLREKTENSKVESDHFIPESKEFDLKEMVSQCLDLVQDMAQIKRMNVAVNMINRPPKMIVTDKPHLQEALVSLLKKSISHSYDGGKVDLVVELLKTEKSMCTLRFAIKDYGKGLKPEHLDSIFEQSESGVGLSSSRKIVRSLGGELTLESEYGKGSIFAFELSVGMGVERSQAPEEAAPVVVSAPPAPVSTAGAKITSSVIWGTPTASKVVAPPGTTVEPVVATEPAAVPSNVGELRILLAEDNLINQKVLQKILKKIGHECTLANNGLEAVEFCSKLQFDIIFMDIKMPKKDGITATKEILQMENNKNAIIIAVTANAFEEEKTMCFSAGMKAYLTKPVSQQAIESEFFKQVANIPPRSA